MDPPVLPLTSVHTGMVYVICCSHTEAVYSNGHTYMTAYQIIYGTIDFTLNNGDHQLPIL